MVCRIGKFDATPKEIAYTVELMQGVENNFPNLIREMELGPTEKRKWLRGQRAQLAPGESTNDFGLCSVSDPRIQNAMQQFGRKLLLGLFYRHTRSIFPAIGSFAFRWFGNANMDDIHPIVAQVTPGLTLPNRATTSLGDQFFYRHGVANTRRATAFIAFFHDSVAILGVMFAYEPNVEVPKNGATLKPFDWTQSAT